MNKFINNNEGQKDWPSGKVPTIQIAFLRLLLDHEQSKTTAYQRMKSHSYPDISDAVEVLLELKFIEKSREDRGIHFYERGHKAEKFYKITDNGLNSLLKVFTLLSPQQFWESAFLFSIRQDDYFEKNEFERIYHEYERKIIGYYPKNGYLIRPFSINLLFQKWYKDNYKLDNNDSVSVPDSQKILECLARYRSLTLDQLVTKTQIPRGKILMILEGNSNTVSTIYQTYNILSDLNTTVDPLYREFTAGFDVMSLAIYEDTSKEEKKYELSLFGVMLVLTIIRHFYYGIDDLYNSQDLPIDLYYNDLDLNSYYDIIATNYHDKLPLIFGKWNLLKKNFRSRLYDNFDFAIYKNPNNNTFDSSILSEMYKGNKEFYNDLTLMSDNNLRYLNEFFTKGISTYESYKKKYSAKINNSIVSKKLFELADLIDYLSKINNIIKPDYDDGNDITIGPSKPLLKKFENSFVITFTFLFFLNMNIPHYLLHKKDSIETETTKTFLIEKEEREVGNPTQRLLAVVDKDKEIKKWLSDWIKDILDYRKNASKKISILYDEVNYENKKVVKKK